MAASGKADDVQQKGVFVDQKVASEACLGRKKAEQYAQAAFECQAQLNLVRKSETHHYADHLHWQQDQEALSKSMNELVLKMLTRSEGKDAIACRN